MPDDPKECRLQAAACLLHARLADDGEGYRLWSDMAEQWLRLARDCEDSAPLEASSNLLNLA
jgi:hypothetical protein